MSLTKQQLNELWELADKAEDSDRCNEPSSWKEDGKLDQLFKTLWEISRFGGLAEDIAEFIFACDPQTIKALIEMARGKK